MNLKAEEGFVSVPHAKESFSFPVVVLDTWLKRILHLTAGTCCSSQVCHLALSFSGDEAFDMAAVGKPAVSNDKD